MHHDRKRNKGITITSVVLMTLAAFLPKKDSGTDCGVISGCGNHDK
jgi:hypothetical protein